MKDRMIYIYAAYDCLESIEAYIQGYDLDLFLQDKKTQDAVCYIRKAIRKSYK